VDTDKKIFIIIVTYNGMQWIENCLKSVLSSSVAVKIIIVDNGSKDGTVEFIKSNFKDVLLFEQNQNLGFGKANNVGLDIALKNNGEYFVLLNQDAYLEKDTISLLFEEMRLNPEYGILSPVHLNGKGNKIDLYFQFYISPNNCPDFFSDLFLNKVLKNVYDVNFINAAIWMLSKETLKNVGGFNPYFFHYAEDNDYVNRCNFKKMNVGIVPKAIAYHDRNLPNRKFDLKTFINLKDLDLLDPNRLCSAKKMIIQTIKKSIISIIKLKKTDAFYNYQYLKKMIKNYHLIKRIQITTCEDNYSFLTYRD